jgi:hypothetical protein
MRLRSILIGILFMCFTLISVNNAQGLTCKPDFTEVVMELPNGKTVETCFPTDQLFHLGGPADECPCFDQNVIDDFLSEYGFSYCRGNTEGPEPGADCFINRPAIVRFNAGRSVIKQRAGCTYKNGITGTDVTIMGLTLQETRVCVDLLEPYFQDSFVCQNDADCMLFSSFCSTTGCTCLPLHIYEPDPVCDGEPIVCITDPCLPNFVPVCDSATNKCIVGP